MKKKKALIVTASVLAVLLIAYAAMALIPPARNFEHENPMMKQELPILIAHGGGNRVPRKQNKRGDKAIGGYGQACA